MKYRMTKTRAKKFLRACDELIEAYKKDPNGRGHSSGCPLCHIALNNCVNCPWLIFNEEYCSIEAHYNRIINKDRLPRLRGWKVKLKNIIKKGGLK